MEFARYGYAATQTSAIATRAGVSQPNVYANFASKEELFLECLRTSLSCIELAVAQEPEELAPVHACLLFQAIASIGLREVGESVQSQLRHLVSVIGQDAFEAMVLQGQSLLMTVIALSPDKL
ncbi:helix-turn-helix transcriptional regulator [Leucobacter denitrificans]|uniref:Helix-turn-helix transcriptional regulator n=1 Tax=Leucobacter denitrificans TaxID=683042 RepID=A0A7G9S7L5_9MICO|nr:helix-turn-helix transcriptional regulator [Leucobacter denitrificans]